MRMLALGLIVGLAAGLALPAVANVGDTFFTATHMLSVGEQAQDAYAAGVFDTVSRLAWIAQHSGGLKTDKLVEVASCLDTKGDTAGILGRWASGVWQRASGSDAAVDALLAECVSGSAPRSGRMVAGTGGTAVPGASPGAPPGEARPDLEFARHLAGQWRVYSSRLFYDQGGGGPLGMNSATPLVLSESGEWSYGPSSGTFTASPIAPADWSRWHVTPHGPTLKLVLHGWNRGTADGPIETETGQVVFLWVIYRVGPPTVQAPGTAYLKFGH